MFQKNHSGYSLGNQSGEEKNGCRKISELGWVRGYVGLDLVGSIENGKKWMGLRDIQKVVTGDCED